MAVESTMPSPSKSHSQPVGSPVDVDGSNVSVSPDIGLEGSQVKSAVGAGGGVIVAMSGRYSIWAVALEVRWSVCPPNTKDRSGVTSWKVPRTVTVVVLPAARGQPGMEHVRVMSVEAIATDVPLDSSWMRHTMLLLTGSHAPSWTNVACSFAACIAPSRAALFRLMFA